MFQFLLLSPPSRRSYYWKTYAALQPCKSYLEAILLCLQCRFQFLLLSPPSHRSYYRKTSHKTRNVLWLPNSKNADPSSLFFMFHFPFLSPANHRSCYGETWILFLYSALHHARAKFDTRTSRSCGVALSFLGSINSMVLFSVEGGGVYIAL